MVKSLQALAFAMAVAVIATLPGTAKATLIGDEVTITFSDVGFGNFSDTGIAGVDFFAIEEGSGPRLDLVFGASFIEIDFSSEIASDAFFFTDGTLVFSGLDWGGAGFISGATMTETVLDTLLAPSDLTFTANSVALDLSSVTLSNGETVRIDLVTQHTPVAVPEPGTLALFGLGFAGLGFARRKRLQCAA